MIYVRGHLRRSSKKITRVKRYYRKKPRHKLIGFKKDQPFFEPSQKDTKWAERQYKKIIKQDIEKDIERLKPPREVTEVALKELREGEEPEKREIRFTIGSLPEIKEDIFKAKEKLRRESLDPNLPSKYYKKKFKSYEVKQLKRELAKKEKEIKGIIKDKFLQEKSEKEKALEKIEKEEEKETPKRKWKIAPKKAALMSEEEKRRLYS